MNSILIAVIIIAGLGLIVGLLLSVSSIIFSVKKNELESEIRQCLPGANCGACGFSGCDGYAKALASNQCESVSLCAPGGAAVAESLAKLLGKQAESVVPTAAFVHCAGSCDKAQTKLNYSGVKSCKLAVQLFEGQKECTFGCVGFGDCVAECEYDAITLCNGVAHIDADACKSCGKCIKICPKHIISLAPRDKKLAHVLCSNTQKGPVARKSCKAACIGCGKCERTCSVGAVKVENFLAVIDAQKCIGCGDCVAGCPVKALSLF